MSSSSSPRVLPSPPLDPSTTEKMDDDEESGAIDIGSAYIVSDTDDYGARRNANVVGDADDTLVINASADGDRSRIFVAINIVCIIVIAN